VHIQANLDRLLSPNNAHMDHCTLLRKHHVCAVPSHTPLIFVVHHASPSFTKELYGLTTTWCVCRKRASSNDTHKEKNRKWINSVGQARILMSNDIDYKKGVKVDGILANILTSGGDQLQVHVRRLHLGNSFPLSHSMSYTIALSLPLSA
jgi:hypothetical protein